MLDRGRHASRWQFAHGSALCALGKMRREGYFVDTVVRGRMNEMMDEARRRADSMGSGDGRCSINAVDRELESRCDQNAAEGWSERREHRSPGY